MYYGIGFTHSDVYNMPIYLRNFYYQELLGAKKSEQENIQKAQRKHKSISRPPKSVKPVRNPRFK